MHEQLQRTIFSTSAGAILVPGGSICDFRTPESVS